MEKETRAVLEKLVSACQAFASRQWVLATGGNFSVRDPGEQGFWITRSGTDKSRLDVSDFLLCDLGGSPIDSADRPSAETPVHAHLYERSEVGAVLHTHSVSVTVLSRMLAGHLELDGFEMQKTQTGCTSHAGTLRVPVHDNSQVMSELVGSVRDKEAGVAHGFLVRGHGLYAWGANVEQARRHLEGLEFLCACALEERRVN